MKRKRDEATSDHAAETAGPLSRRHFLAAAGAGGATVAAVAATGGMPGAGAAVASRLGAQSGSGDQTSTTSAGTGGGNATGDVATATFAASLEVLATQTYQAALDAATAGKLGAVPPAGAEYVMTALQQHQAQLERWNYILHSVGEYPVTEPDPKLNATVQQQFAQVSDFVGAAKLARTLEETAAATYLKAIPSLSSRPLRELVASIQIVDREHVAILNYVLGEYPIPDTFAKTEMAASP